MAPRGGAWPNKTSVHQRLFIDMSAKVKNEQK